MKDIRAAVRSAVILAFGQLLVLAPPGLTAQEAPPAREAALPHSFSYVEQVLRALDASRAIVYEVIADSPANVRAELDEGMFARLVSDGVAAGQTPRAMDSGGEGAQSSGVPADIQALLDRTDELYWNLLTLAADPDPSRLEREGESLVRAYQQGETWLATAPTDMEVVAQSTPVRAFQQAYPRLHGLIWAQTWLRLAVFEPLLVYRTPAARQAGLSAVLARFWGMLDEPPLRFPTAMPMVPTIAQTLAYLSPEAAAILENEDMLRESIGDILVTEPAGSRSDALMAVLAGFQDGGYRRISRFAWRQMAVMHGVGNQGGWAVAILTPPEQDGSGMTHGVTSVMPGMN